MRYNDKGEELPDDTPIAIPVNFRRPPTLQEQIKLMVAHEVSRRAVEEGVESFEEADDFDMDDDEALPPSNYEFRDMPVESRLAKRDASVLDKPEPLVHDGGAVNSDRNKEVSNGGEDGKGSRASGGGESSRVGGVSGAKG